MKITQRVKCPYCDLIQNVTVDYEIDYTAEIHHCDHDEGGCDRPFIIRVKIDPDFKVLAIENVEQFYD